jgi:RNA polymerase sigma-B factor
MQTPLCEPTVARHRFKERHPKGAALSEPASNASRTTTEERLHALPDAELLEAVRAEDPVRREAARTVLVRRYRWMVHRAVQRYAGRGEERAVLDQVAVVGLLEAVSRFDPRRGAFTAFAFPTVLGELKRHFRDRRRWVQVPRRVQELCPEVEWAQEHLAQRNGRHPSLEDIASYLGVGLVEVEQAVRSTAMYSPASLDAAVHASEPEGPTVGDCMGEEDAAYERSELMIALHPALRELSARERELLRLRFWSDCTQSEIGELMGLSQMHVSRLLRQTIDRLRAQVDI